MTTAGTHAIVLRRSTYATTIDVEVLATEAGVHPDVVHRLVRRGLLEPAGGTLAAPVFHREAAALLARAVRLRRDLGLDYAGALLAGELLSRIDALEARLARYENPDHRRR